MKGFSLRIHPDEWSSRALLLSLLLLSTVLRLYQLDSDPLWWPDEAGTLYLSQPERSWGEVIAGSLEFEGALRLPLSFLLTHLSLLLFGVSEFALRLPAALVGAVTPVAIYALGRTLFGNRIGLLAAGLLAVSPFHIRYSQEARYYALFCFFSILSLFFFYRMMEERKGKWALGWIASSLLNLLTFPLAALVLLVELLSSPAWFRQWRSDLGPVARNWFERGKMLAAGWFILGLFSLALVPGLLSTSATFAPQENKVAAPLQLGPYTFSAILTLYSGVDQIPSLIFAALAFWGVGASIVSPRKLFFLLAILVLPFVFAALNPTFHAIRLRYLIFTLPVFLLLVAEGTVRLADTAAHRLKTIPSSWLAAGMGLVLGLATLPAINDYYSEGKQAWRRVGLLLEREVLPGETVVLAVPPIFIPHAQALFSLYYSGPFHTLAYGAQGPLPASTRSELETICAPNSGIWIVTPVGTDLLTEMETTGCRWGRSRHFRVRRADGRLLFLIAPMRYASIGLTYAHNTPAIPSPDFREFKANFADKIVLRGYSLRTIPHRPGDVFRLTLWWQATGLTEEDYTIFVHLLGPYNSESGNLLWGQEDQFPKDGFYPTSLWQAGEVVADGYEFLVSSSAPGGIYRIEIGIYDYETGERLTIVEAEGEVADNAVLLPEEVSIFTP